MQKRAFFWIVAASVLWGTSGIFVHFLAPLGFSALQMSAMRGAVAAVCFFLYILVRDKSLFRVSGRELLLTVASGISMYGCGTCYYASMQMTSVSTAVMLMYTAPVMVMAYSVAFMGEKLTKKKLLSLIAMLIGCALICGVIGGLKFHLLGILIGFLSGISYSIYNIVTKIQMQKKMNPITATFYCFVWMALLALVIAPPTKMAAPIAAAPYVSIALMLGIGICTSVLPYFLYTCSLKHLPVGTAAALGIIEPMAATVFSVALLGEKPDLSSVCGTVLILGAVFILSRETE